MKPPRISPEAGMDLEEIWFWVARRGSVAAAERLLGAFHEAFRALAQSPAIGVKVPHLGRPGTRRFPVGQYLVYYRPEGRRAVRILRVLHGRREQARALRKPPGT